MVLHGTQECPKTFQRNILLQQARKRTQPCDRALCVQGRDRLEVEPESYIGRRDAETSMTLRSEYHSITTLVCLEHTCRLLVTVKVKDEAYTKQE